MKSFEEIRSEFTEYTAVDFPRMQWVHDLVAKTRALNGYNAEIGVYKGGSAYVIAATALDKTLLACDSFEGLPEIAPEDLVNGRPRHAKGNFSDTSLEAVKTLLDPLGNVILYKGFFPNENLVKEFDKKFSFVHIDVDLYESTLKCLEFFWPRMVKGGIILSDDYKWVATPGVEKAFIEYFGNSDIKINDTGVNSCWVEKP